MTPNYPALSPDGHTLTWHTWDGDHTEVVEVRWDNEAWTVTGKVGRENVEYVLRLSPNWQVRQLLLFRDLEEPDLWLATDGHARWGEMNGAHRTELDGCVDVDLPCTPFTRTLLVRRLPLGIGDSAQVQVARVDVETLGVVHEVHRYTRLGDRQWRFESVSESPSDDDSGDTAVFHTDELGFILDWPQRFRRAS